MHINGENYLKWSKLKAIIDSLNLTFGFDDPSILTSILTSGHVSYANLSLALTVGNPYTVMKAPSEAIAIAESLFRNPPPITDVLNILNKPCQVNAMHTFLRTVAVIRKACNPDASFLNNPKNEKYYQIIDKLDANLGANCYYTKVFGGFRKAFESLSGEDKCLLSMYINNEITPLEFVRISNEMVWRVPMFITYTFLPEDSRESNEYEYYLEFMRDYTSEVIADIYRNANNRIPTHLKRTDVIVQNLDIYLRHIKYVTEKLFISPKTSDYSEVFELFFHGGNISYSQVASAVEDYPRTCSEDALLHHLITIASSQSLNFAILDSLVKNNGDLLDRFYNAKHRCVQDYTSIVKISNNLPKEDCLHVTDITSGIFINKLIDHSYEEIVSILNEEIRFMENVIKCIDTQNMNMKDPVNDSEEFVCSGVAPLAQPTMIYKENIKTWRLVNKTVLMLEQICFDWTSTAKDITSRRFIEIIAKRISGGIWNKLLTADHTITLDIINRIADPKFDETCVGYTWTIGVLDDTFLVNAFVHLCNLTAIERGLSEFWNAQPNGMNGVDTFSTLIAEELDLIRKVNEKLMHAFLRYGKPIPIRTTIEEIEDENHYVIYLDNVIHRAFQESMSMPGRYSYPMIAEMRARQGTHPIPFDGKWLINKIERTLTLEVLDTLFDDQYAPSDMLRFMDEDIKFIQELSTALDSFGIEVANDMYSKIFVQKQ